MLLGNFYKDKGQKTMKTTKYNFAPSKKNNTFLNYNTNRLKRHSFIIYIKDNKEVKYSKYNNKQ
jgi:hypothetical protein